MASCSISATSEYVGFVFPRHRPSALYLNTKTRNPGEVAEPDFSDTCERGGYGLRDYGDGGNGVAMTVHGQCRDVDVDHLCQARSGALGGEWEAVTDGLEARPGHRAAGAA